MLSESTRMRSAAEARFRVQAPNSRPRAVKVIALDTISEAVVRRLSHGEWTQATFLTIASDDDAAARAGRTPASADGALRDLDGRARSVSEEIATADLVVLIAAPGGRAGAASSIGQACSLRRVMTTGFIVGVRGASEAALSQTLAQVRPWSLMVVIATSDEYIDDMMTALRA